MPTAEEFIAVAERNLRVIQAVVQALETMALVDFAAVEVEGKRWRVSFACEMTGLREALYLMGHDMNQESN